MKNRKIIRWHIAVWLAFSSLFFLPLVLHGVSNQTIYQVFNFLINISIFYINLLFILPRWVRKRKIIPLLLSWFALILFYTFISVALGYFLHADVFNKRSGVTEFFDSSLGNFLFIGFFLFISTAYKFIMDWFQNEKIRLELKNQNLKTELSFLKSQINPHFLFNTLNNIYILAYHHSDKTADAIMKLSEMMHYMLYESTDEYVLLTKEIDCIDRLIALQQLRMKAPMALQFAVSSDAQNYTIAPLLLMAFVENVFKHGVLNDNNEAAIIRLNIKADRLLFYSRNKISDSLKDPAKGIGLPNVKRRMELLYPGRHHLEIKKDGEYYSVNLTIQLV